MISSATLFLATLVFHVVAVLGAPISIPAEIVPRSVDTSNASVRFARDEVFPSPVPAFVARAVSDALPVFKREAEDIVRRFPRRFIHEYLEKRGTTVTEKVTVFEKVIKHDNPADTVAYNNGQPQNNNNAANGGAGGLTTTIGFSATITVPGVPTATTVTTTVTATVTPTGTPPAAGNTGATPGDATKPDGTTPDATKPDGTTTASGTTPTGTTTTTTDNTTKPADGTTKPADGTTTTGDNTTTTTATGTDPNATNGGDDTTKPAGSTTTTTTTDGDNKSADGTTPDGTTTTTDGTTESRRDVKTASNQPIAKRQPATSGAAFASSLRRRAL